jgi:uncharacterized protein with HEPN domain
MSKRDVSRLYDMLDAARKALSFVEGRSRQDLDSNEMLALALVRLLEVLGEAARFVPDKIKAEHPEIQWREIAATRNRLIHGYFSVDLDIVWSIVENDLPPLVKQLEAIVAEE